jgi:hypothetical protein
MKITVKNSPNQSPRQEGPVRLVICHTPEGGDVGTISTIMHPRNEVSYHRLYLKGGKEAIQFVPFARKAWHAKTYNSLSDGLAVSGFARHFDLRDPSVKEFAKGVASRLISRGLRPQWTTDPRKGGFCRHGDIQGDRTDPTPDLAEWKLFVGMVQAEYARQKGSPSDAAPWPVPLPDWTWDWMAWKLGDKPGPRPKSAPRRIPIWAWRRLRALQNARLV